MRIADEGWRHTLPKRDKWYWQRKIDKIYVATWWNLPRMHPNPRYIKSRE
jgi:hypothetical protein